MKAVEIAATLATIVRCEDGVPSALAATGEPYRTLVLAVESQQTADEQEVELAQMAFDALKAQVLDAAVEGGTKCGVGGYPIDTLRLIWRLRPYHEVEYTGRSRVRCRYLITAKPDLPQGESS